MDISQFSQINPPQRLLMGPGPINADPRVLRAMSSQLLGQYDPAMTHYMNEVMALYRGVFRTENRWTLLIDGTSRAGIEAILLSAIRPGDKVLVPVYGRFGHLLCEIARRCRADVHTIAVPWERCLRPIRSKMRLKSKTAFAVDRTGRYLNHYAAARWRSWGRSAKIWCAVLHRCHGVAGGQCAGNRCMGPGRGVRRHAEMPGGPSGTSPITLSDEMAAVIRQRKCVEQDPHGCAPGWR